MITFKLFYQLLFLVAFHFDHYVFRFEIGMDDMTSLMQVDKSDEYISGYFFDKPEGHLLIFELVVLNKIQKVGSHEFKNTAHMFAMDAEMWEIIQQKQRSAKFRIDKVGILGVVLVDKVEPLLIFLMLANGSQHLQFIDC